MSKKSVVSQPIFEAEPVYRGAPDDDLLTAGFGLDGLKNAILPAGVSARAAAIHKDFRDLVDVSAEGGFEDIIPGGAEALRVNGWEHSALVQLPGSGHAIGIRVLIPDSFNWDRPLLIVAPSSGSRGVTGAIGDIGAWALPRGYALALTDKGTGGVQLLDDNTCYGPDFEPLDGAHLPTTFRLEISAALRHFRQHTPGAIALKHAHSMDNAEADWPRAVLAAARYGLEVLGRQGALGQQGRVKVIAAGVSNGGGAVLRAAEVDLAGIIDAVVAVEPNITPRESHGGLVQMGDDEPTACGCRLVDYATAMNLLLPAALLASDLADMPFIEVTALSEARQAAWAKGLAEHGLVTGSSTAERAADALSRINALGFAKGAMALFPMMSMMHVWPAVAHTFVNALGRFPVEADPIGAHTAFVRTDPFGQVLEAIQSPTQEQRRLYGALSGGLSPGGGAFTIYANGDIHPSLEDALNLRQFALGAGAHGKRVLQGSAEVLANARPHGHPTIILHGRCDSLISPQHASRAYFAACLASRGDTRHWRYYEHSTAQHFDTLLGIPGLSRRFDSLLPSFFQALDLMQQHLFDERVLPPSQVLRTTSFDGGKGGEIDLSVRRKPFKTILTEPRSDRIEFSGRILKIFR